MNDIQVFNNPEFGEIRTVEIDGKPYFVANDVASALGYKRPADAVTTHCKGSVKYRYLTSGGKQEIKVIPEGDLYRLIVKSKLPSAEKFEMWVFDEVLPAIRKHGSTPYFMEYFKTNEYGTFRIFMERSKTIQNKHEHSKITQLKGTTQNTTVLCECSHLEKLQKVAKEVATFIATLHLRMKILPAYFQVRL